MENDLIKELKQFIRVINEDADLELEGLVESCKKELEIAGVYGDESDKLYRQAIRLYCKAYYGYDDDAERFKEAYGALRDSMALSGDYKRQGANNGSDIDMGG